MEAVHEDKQNSVSNKIELDQNSEKLSSHGSVTKDLSLDLPAISLETDIGMDRMIIK